MIEKEQKLNKYNLLLAVSIITALFGLISPYLIRYYYDQYKISELGPIGDWLGGTTAPILGLAGFMMVLAAFFAQKEELNAQKEELRLTREEFKEQNLTLSLQRFENTFFHLVTLHHEIVNSIDTQLKGAVVKGRAYFPYAYSQFKSIYQEDIPMDLSLTKEVQLKLNYKFIIEAYEKFFFSQQSQIGHYFRNLYHILKLIDTSILEEHEKKKYSSLIRAQLSTYELLLLYYNAISHYGSDKLKTLLDRFDFFQNMDFHLLINCVHEEVYDELENLQEESDIA